MSESQPYTVCEHIASGKRYVGIVFELRSREMGVASKRTIALCETCSKKVESVLDSIDHRPYRAFKETP